MLLSSWTAPAGSVEWYGFFYDGFHLVVCDWGTSFSPNAGVGASRMDLLYRSVSACRADYRFGFSGDGLSPNITNLAGNIEDFEDVVSSVVFRLHIGAMK